MNAREVLAARDQAARDRIDASLARSVRRRNALLSEGLTEIADAERVRQNRLLDERLCHMPKRKHGRPGRP